MKKSVITCLFFVLFLTSCAGVSDWSYELPNDYEVWHINSKEILIKYVGDKNKAEEIGTFIKEFSYDERYVFTRNVDDIEENDISKEKYYILDTFDNVVYGPYDNIEEMSEKSHEMGTQIPEKWYRTYNIS